MTMPSRSIKCTPCASDNVSSETDQHFLSRTTRLASAALVSSVLASTLMLSSSALAAAAMDRDKNMTLVVPPWPGVTVKSEIVAQILTPMGYTVERQEVSSTVGYKTMTTGDSDAFLAGWLPAQQDSYDAAISNGAITDLGNNVTGARMGFAVPGYVYDAGIHSAADLAASGDKFDKTFYSIESGSTVSDFINNAVDNNVYDLGDWDVMESSTPGMLSEVRAAARNQTWIVFYGWTPHWMVPEFDVHILDDPDAVYGGKNGASDVKTIVSTDFATANPNMTRFLDQLIFSADEQSAFILDYGLNERDLEDVAHDWIQAHPQKLAEFLDGVTTRDGGDAIAAVDGSL
ncbi:ABC transporter substrate-binding protein [Cobetia sp. L2A1]|uniref:ABC transporter substrate-binding protein n=1 Tax=Cobetia sp. L2A1 TaxID=2686360 RepID=UPI002D80F9F4|nr:ABC transporter substrate-binding protein [Cobetia sp. L2A1]